MSHLKKLPAPNSMRFAPSGLPIAPRSGGIQTFCSALVLAFTLALNSGCTIVQIPSYRLEECAAESCSSPPIVLPTMPTVPMPGWLARWKAEKDLPKPPAAPRFHPLPTRPMFQPEPTTDFGVGAPGETACYGTLPPPQSWNRVESAPPAQVPTLAKPL